MTEQSTAKHKLAILVNSHIAPKIASFVADLSDEELVELLTAFKTMNIDLMKDLTKEADKRKIRSKQWTEDSPFDAIMEEGLNK
jgi:arsenate reductase-like glutaredoxin family protein